MKKTLLITILASGLWLLASNNSHANSLLIENVSIVSKDKANKTSTVEFDISWDHSWRGSRNHDAVWVFVKYQLNSDSAWYHANLKTAGTNPADVDRGTGTEIDIVVPTDKIGAFIERSNTGAGTTSVDDLELIWDWDASGLDADDVIAKVQVFGIEMTYIPSGSFYLGDTTVGTANFEAAISGAVFQVTSEDALTLGGGGAGSLGNNNAEGGPYDPDDFNNSASQTLPAAFPKGYDGFYCMKYEISQGQFRDFLNTLTLDQQDTRTWDDLSNNDAATHYVMIDDNQTTVSSRNGLYAQTNPGASTPYVISCDVDDNGTPNESDDGEWIACNYLSWMDGCAYADWAGLRPMTELEFEKVCRGSLTPVADEYAWGSTDLTQAEGAVQNPGENNEVANTTGNGLANYNGAGTDISGPLRVGFAAASATSRVSSGSGYYGNMNLTGNLVELVATVGTTNGRSFTGTHGDGTLTTTASYEGNATNTDWPGIDGTPARGVTDGSGSGYRGGAYDIASTYLTVSERGSTNFTGGSRNPYSGVRLVRNS